MKRKQLLLRMIWSLITALIILLVNGCGTVRVPRFTPSPIPTNPQTPTNTVTPTSTSTNTTMFTPTLTSTTTPTPLPEPIGSGNAERIELNKRYGDGSVIQISFSPDNQNILLLTTVNMMMFDANSGELIWLVETGSAQQQATITKDGGSVVTMTKGGSVQFWDASTGKKEEEYHIFAQENIIQSTISQDGKYLLTLDIDRQMRLYELPYGNIIHENIPRISSHFDVLNVTLSHTGDSFMVHCRQGYHWFLQAWDARTGKFSHSLKEFPQYYIYSGLQAFSQDGKRFGALIFGDLINGTLNSIFVVWDVASGKKMNEFVFDHVVTSFDLPSNGETALVGYEDGTIRHYRVGDSNEIGEFKGHQTAIAAMSVSSDSKKFVSVDFLGVIKVWDLTGKTEGQTMQIELSRTTGPFLYRYNTKGPYYYRIYPDYAMTLDPLGQMAAIFAPDMKSINLMNVSTGEVIDNLVLNAGGFYPLSLSFSEDGKTLGGALDNGDIVLWDVERGHQILQFSTDHQNYIYRIAFTPDGKRIASLGYEQIFVWDTSSGEKVSNMYGYLCFDISPDGNDLASDNIDFGLYVWETETGKLKKSIPAEYIFDLAYSPDGSTIAVAGFQIRKDIRSNINLVYFVDTENEYQHLPIELTEHRNRPMALSFSPDGNILVTADFLGNIYLWDVANSKLMVTLEEVTSFPLKLGFSADQTTLIVVGSDGTIRKYQVRP